MPLAAAKKTTTLLRLARKGPVRPRDLDEGGIPRVYLWRLCEGSLLPKPRGKMSWKLEITNDPRHDFRLVFELWEDEQLVAMVERDDSGQLVLTVCPNKTFHAVPAEWLIELLTRARVELPPDQEDDQIDRDIAGSEAPADSPDSTSESAPPPKSSA